MSRLSSPPPRYTYKVHLIIMPALRVLLGIASPPHLDAALLLQGAHPRPRVLSVENIPPEGPFVLTVNHYDRPGLGAWWGVAAIFDAVAQRRAHEPRDVHFAMAREWWYPSGFGRRVKQPLTRWFFGQLAKSYGVIRLPPVLGTDEFRGQGALEVRHAAKLTRGPSPQLVGLAPEGRTGENLTLCEPPEGAGLFLLMLTHDTVPCLPVGLYEDEDAGGILTVNFGPPFQLHVPRGLPREARDRAAARTVMVEIGKLLPARMWGVYHEGIARTGLLSRAEQGVSPIGQATP